MCPRVAPPAMFSNGRRTDMEFSALIDRGGPDG
jgi:hypothetical protein